MQAIDKLWSEIESSFRCRLCWRITIGVFLSILFVESIILVFSVRNFENSHLLELEREALVVIRTIIRSADSEGNLASEFPQTGRLFRDNSVLVGARLFSDTHMEIAEFGERPARFEETLWNPDKTARQSMENLARLDVLWPPDRVRAPYYISARIDVSDTGAVVNAYMWRIIGMVFLITLFVTFVTMLVLNSIILSPIRTLSNRMVAAASEPSNLSQHSLRSPRRDEWGAVVESFNRMLRRIDGNLGQMKKKGAELQSQLNQAQKLEAIGQLTSGVAHDFNNLLAIMLGNAELLLRSVATDEEAKERIRIIIETADRGASLTGRLLAFSREQTLAPVSVDVIDLIDGLEEMLRRTLGAEIDLVVEKIPDSWPAIIDPHQFENAFLNLAINARDAMPNGGKLLIETANVTLDETYAAQHEEMTPGDYVMVAVSDAGSGMPPEVLDKVFEPFFTTKDVGMGSGLGLSMVYGFVKQSRGHITIYSEVGYGTTVKLYVPRSGIAAVKLDAKNDTQAFARGWERILVVEDDESLREVSASLLRDQGYEVVEARDGKEAIEHLRDGQPVDLLFTDIVLPGGMNGVEIAEEAKRIQHNIKVLFTSGYTKHAVVLQGKLDPGRTLVKKPYHQAELLEKVRSMLDSLPLPKVLGENDRPRP